MSSGRRRGRGRAEAILGEVVGAVRAWPELAAKAGVEEERATGIGATHRFDLLRG